MSKLARLPSSFEMVKQMPFTAILSPILHSEAISPISIAFTSAGKPDIPMKISIVKTCTNVSLGLLLVPISLTILNLDVGGINGATIALGLSYIIEVVLFFMLIKSYLRFIPNARFILTGLVLFFAVIALAFIMMTHFELSGNIVGLILIPIYAACLYYFGIVTKGGLSAFLRIVGIKNKA